MLQRGLLWDGAAALHAIDFFSHLRHSSGEWANQPFAPQPWQGFVIGALFGWKRADGLRRFRTANVEVARKNGKSVMLAGTALYPLIADGEPGSHVYAAATTRDQAKIVFGEAERMVDASPALRARVTRTVNNLAVLAISSWFRLLSADASVGSAATRRLVVPAANERRQHGLITAGRDAEKIDDRYSVLERLAKPSVIGHLRLDTDQSDLSYAWSKQLKYRLQDPAACPNIAAVLPF